MAHCEVDSFVSKFKYLCHAGIKATLQIEGVGGEASVTLTARLGPIHPPPPHALEPNGQPSRYYRGPSYRCRQEQRKAAREAALQVEEVVTDAEEADGTSAAAAEEAATALNSGETEEVSIEKIQVPAYGDVIEKVTDDSNDVGDVSLNESGTIPQLNGGGDTLLKDTYC